MPVVLHCHNCSHERRVTDEEVLALLQSHGMLRRENAPEMALMSELLLSIAGQIRCDSCGAAGPDVKDDWADDWVDGVKCEGCGAAISSERLEVFPHAKLCSSCQSAQESGKDVHREVEYCSRCGGIMKLTRRGGSGLAGYRMVCGDCGKG